MSSWIRFFFIFLPKLFSIFDDFSKNHSSFDMLHFGKFSNNMTKNLAKNEEKPCSTCLKHIFWLILGTPKFNFGYPIHHYICRKRKIDFLNSFLITYYFSRILAKDWHIWRTAWHTFWTWNDYSTWNWKSWQDLIVEYYEKLQYFVRRQNKNTKYSGKYFN